MGAIVAEAVAMLRQCDNWMSHGWCRGSKADSRMRGRYEEARSQLWRSCTHKIYEFRPFTVEVIALRLGARRRSTGLYVCGVTGGANPCP